jgi:hypothetical protein
MFGSKPSCVDALPYWSYAARFFSSERMSYALWMSWNFSAAFSSLLVSGCHFFASCRQLLKDGLLTP